ncbi:MAG TPA: hypothetical protein VMV92_34940, partial [Streptosporangiaceae bacterium]|nr:hypothetical protein [Streptosporangiaceae bacterium]
PESRPPQSRTTANTVVTGKSRTPPGVSQPSSTQDSAAAVTGIAKTYVLPGRCGHLIATQSVPRWRG